VTSATLSAAQAKPARAALTEGPVGRTLFNLAWPSIGGVLAIMSTSLIDAYLAGRLGVAEQAAIGLTFPVAFMVSSLGLGVAVGTAAGVARALGANEPDRVQRLAAHAFLLGLVLVSSLSILGLLTIGPVFKGLGATPAMMGPIHDYMHVWYVSAPLVMCTMVGNGIQRAFGDTRAPAVNMVAIAVVKLLTAFPLTLGMGDFAGFGIAGAALSTILAFLAGATISLYQLRTRQKVLVRPLPPLSGAIASWRQILHIGVPSMLTNMMGPICMAVANRALAGSGEVAVAAYGAVATRIEALALIAPMAISGVIGPFLGQNLGAGRTDRMREAMRLMVGFCLIYGLVIAALLAVLAGPSARLFSGSAEIADVAKLYLWIVPISFGAYALTMVVAGAFNGMGDPKPNFILYSSKTVLVFLPGVWIGAQYGGFVGVCLAASAANLFGGALAYWFYRRGFGAQRLRPAPAE
jgi:putative MATE family efflux protein